MYMKDPGSGRDSVTLTAFIIGFAVCLVKLALAGMIILGVKFSAFSGVDFAAAVGSLGVIYGYRKSTEANRKSNIVASDESEGS